MCFVVLFYGLQSFAQSISGVVIDSETKEKVPFAKVVAVDFNVAVQTDENGQFEIQGKFPTKIILRITLSSYESITEEISTSEFITISLQPVHYSIEEVKITASKNELKRNIVSYVELKSIEELNELPKSSLGQMLETIPGVYNLSTGPGISKPVIRGLQGTRVLTLLNGVRLEGQQWGGDHGLGIGELGVGTIEILKGPASLQYGSDALGGVLYLSNEDYEKQGHHAITAASLFESSTMGTVNSLLYNGATKKIRLLAGGRYASHADYQVPNKEFVYNSRFQDANAKFALGWHSGKWVSDIRYDWSRSTIGIPGHDHEHVEDFLDEHAHEDAESEHAEFFTDVQKRKHILPVQHLSNHIASWENKFVLSKHTIQFITSFTMNQLTEYDENKDEAELLINTYNIPYKLAIETRLKKNVSLTYGLQGMFLTQRNGPEAEERLVPNANQSDNGLYFVTTWKIKQLILQGGLRADLRSVQSYSDEKFTDPFSKVYSGYNFSLGANYTISKKHILRLNATSGFRIPHLSELLSDGEHHGTYRYELGDINLKTERAIQLDLSYEYEGEHLSFMINPFVNSIQDYVFIQPQDSFINDIQLFHYKQSKSGIIQVGADLGVHWHPHFAHFLHVESTFSYLRMIAKSSNEYSLIPQPRWQNSIIARFEMKSKFKVDNIVLQYSYYLPQRQVSAFETASVDFSVLDLGVQCSLEGKVPLKLQVGVRNITNSSYINHLSRLKTLGIQNTGRSFYVKLIMDLKFNT